MVFDCRRVEVGVWHNHYPASLRFPVQSRSCSLCLSIILPLSGSVLFLDFTARIVLVGETLGSGTCS